MISLDKALALAGGGYALIAGVAGGMAIGIGLDSHFSTGSLRPDNVPVALITGGFLSAAAAVGGVLAARLWHKQAAPAQIFDRALAVAAVPFAGVIAGYGVKFVVGCATTCTGCDAGLYAWCLGASALLPFAGGALGLFEAWRLWRKPGQAGLLRVAQMRQQEV